jgi:hypothetical protein
MIAGPIIVLVLALVATIGALAGLAFILGLRGV